MCCHLGSRPEEVSPGLVATFVLVFLPSALPGTPSVLSSASAASSVSARYVSPCMGRYHPCAEGAACLAARLNPPIQTVGLIADWFVYDCLPILPMYACYSFYLGTSIEKIPRLRASRHVSSHVLPTGVQGRVGECQVLPWHDRSPIWTRSTGGVRCQVCAP